jgi:hypothetical protein
MAESLGFETVKLVDEHATADAILTTLRRNLVDDAKPGDLRFVYYSGHGNYVRNTASKESDSFDQTIVPADHFRGVADVRDKEISRILFAAGSKGVKVVFVADSCHSGSPTRGALDRRKVRTAREGSATRPDAPVVNDPADIDPKTGKAIDPASVGVISLARLYHANHDDLAAIREIGAALAASPSNPALLELRGDILAATHRSEEADKTWRMALNHGADRTSARRIRLKLSKF